MNVSKELIAKYHQGLCSDEERASVEAWLNSDSEEELSTTLEIEQKNVIKAEIWSSVKTNTIAQSEKKSLPRINKVRLRPIYQGAAAILAVSFLCVWLLRDGSILQEEKISRKAGLSDKIKDDVNLVLGEDSKASFINSLERINFCGTVKVTVNKTMKLVFSATHADDKIEHRKELMVNAGETYFALELSENEDREIIVKSERELSELPPILQNSLRAQFGI
ncbi:hypothetical protein H8B06_04550 [Sphingobacterium sp. DN00404]|uniref:Anti-sigma factor n=1 Tax=Sphingobacterium micropteri TaxID=2763501 RepID=A0ABR7YL85_9SPHI|nr:hypothetical protein [Sphingobacterium micropteri]MBD1432086.1 hypothetical protein [Sphingobacterium micropteri]